MQAALAWKSQRIVTKPFDKDADESEERPHYGVGGSAFEQATVFDVLQSLPREALIHSLSLIHI